MKDGQIRSDHPKQELVFFLTGNFGQEVPPLIRSVIEKIGSTGSWLIVPPVFVDENHSPQGQAPITIVGGVLEIYCCRPKWIARILKKSRGS